MFDFDVKGAQEAQAGMERMAAELHGEPMVRAIQDCTMLLTADAKRNAPVNTGLLRASITPEIRAGTTRIEGIVGSALEYAPFAELDCRPHWPPPEPIRYWVMRKFQLRGRALQSVTFLVMRKIARHGTKGKHYLQRAFESNVSRIQQIIGNAVASIINSK